MKSSDARKGKTILHVYEILNKLLTVSFAFLVFLAKPPALQFATQDNVQYVIYPALKNDEKRYGLIQIKPGAEKTARRTAFAIVSTPSVLDLFDCFVEAD